MLMKNTGYYQHYDSVHNYAIKLMTGPKFYLPKRTLQVFKSEPQNII